MDECFHKTKCGQPFLLLKDSEHNVTAEAYIGNNKLFGDLDQTVRESHKISDQVSTILCFGTQTTVCFLSSAIYQLH